MKNLLEKKMAFIKTTLGYINISKLQNFYIYEDVEKIKKDGKKLFKTRFGLAEYYSGKAFHNFCKITIDQDEERPNAKEVYINYQKAMDNFLQENKMLIDFNLEVKE
jgi:hypothetical protein